MFLQRAEILARLEPARSRIKSMEAELEIVESAIAWLRQQKKIPDTDPVIGDEKMIWALGRAGFTRLGIYSRHIHADSDPDKAQDIVWFGESHA